jgi:hypothetical protein
VTSQELELPQGWELKNSGQAEKLLERIKKEKSGNKGQ